MIADDLFVSDVPVERTIRLKGKDHVIHLREVSDTDWRRYYAARNSLDPEVAAGARAFLISMSVCEPTGERALTMEKAAQLKLFVAKKFEDEIMLFNQSVVTDAGNESAPRADAITSGTS